MIGAILGDMIGSPYEFDRGGKIKDFPLFSAQSTFTDDTVMTVAVADMFLAAQPSPPVEWTPENLDWFRRVYADRLRQYGKRYPHAGYGGKFRRWLHDPQMGAYNSLGNGSAMRVSPVAWLYNTMENVRLAAKLSAEITHNHPEGIKGAEAVASAIFLARTGHSKAEIHDYIESEFGYDLHRTCDNIRPTYCMDATCPGSVPEAIISFLEGESFEDVIRTAVSLGGDTDTIAAIAGSIAEGFYGVPDELRQECVRRLPEELRKVLVRFEEYRQMNTAETGRKEFAETLEYHFYSNHRSGCYFCKTESGDQALVHPDGTVRISEETESAFKEFGGQAHEGWQRSMLLMDELGIWDAAAFGCTMSTVLAFSFKDKNCEYALLFASCEKAERDIYRHLPKAVVTQCRKNVDAFYADPALQKRWEGIILHPVCLKYVKSSGSFTPVSFDEIGQNDFELNRGTLFSLNNLDELK